MPFETTSTLCAADILLVVDLGEVDATVEERGSFVLEDDIHDTVHGHENLRRLGHF